MNTNTKHLKRGHKFITKARRSVKVSADRAKRAVSIFRSFKRTGIHKRCKWSSCVFCSRFTSSEAGNARDLSIPIARVLLFRSTSYGKGSKRALLNGSDRNRYKFLYNAILLLCLVFWVLYSDAPGHKIVFVTLMNVKRLSCLLNGQ